MMAEKCSILEDDDSGGEVNQVQSIPIFVGYKLPDWITVELLLQHFSSFEDKIDKSRSTIINTPGNRHGKLFFTDSNAASQAIEHLNNSSFKYQGKLFKISVNQWVWKAKDSTGPIRHDHVKKKHQDILLVVTKPQKSETTAWVGENLPEYVTEFQLKNHFREVRNQIEQVTFKQTKSSTRVAFVKFSTAESCNLAVSKYDKTLLQMSSHKMKGSLLEGFQQKDFEFTLNTSLERDLEQTIEMLERADLVKIVTSSSDHGSVPKHEMKIKVSVLSSSDKAFESTCQQLKELDPTTRTIKLKEEEKNVLSEEVISSLKEAHHVYIHGVKDPLLYFIHGLRKVDVDQAFLAMKDHFADIVSITYTMKITNLQAMFLEKKRGKEIDAMDAEVKIRKQYHGKKDGDAVVTIIGLRSPVESCMLELNLLLEKYIEQRVTWEDSGSKYHWTRERKEAVVAEVEAECDVLVHFESNCSASVCGIEEDAIAKAKEIVQECTEIVCLTIEATGEQRKKVGLAAMKENKFKHSLVAIDTRSFDSAGILLYAPRRFNSLVVDLKEEIDSFLSKASHDRQDVSLDPLMSTIIHARYLKKGTEGCKVIFRKEKPGVLTVTGKRDAVQSLVARIQGIIADLQSTFCSQKVVVDKCFQSLLVQQNTYFFMKGIERSHFVEIRLPTGSENETKWAAEVKPIGWSKHCSVKIVQGSLVKEKADALVNQANEDLKLLSGLPRALLKAGGDSIQSECNSYVVKNGKVPTGEAVCLGSGKLPCKKIIHAVPPRWRGGSHEETALLEQTFIRSMDVAADNNCQRIALPALGTGVLHFPMDKCAEWSMSALMKALSKHPDGFEDIKFVLFTEDDVSAFKTIFQALETVPDLNCKVVKISQSDDIPKSTSAKSPVCQRDYNVSRNGDSEASVKGLSITVKGCEEDVLASKKKVMEYFKKQEKEDKWQIPRIFSSKMKTMIRNSCARYSVKVSFEDASKDNVQVLLHGWEKSVTLVKEQCTGELLNLTTAQAHAGVVKKPDEWEEDGSSSVLKVVQNGSAEYNKVLARMRETVPNVKIVKLERIQNEWLWEKFSQHRDRIQYKNQGVVGENDLFHGTRSTDPRFIYEGEEGFDMRFSQAGMWGNGNYFAVNASYSVGYSHPVSGGLRQMFLVRVVIGEAHDCPPNGSLRLPPENSSKTSSLFSVERYDSVTGITGGSRVYIIYDNLKAYPLYLITFST